MPQTHTVRMNGIRLCAIWTSSGRCCFYVQGPVPADLPRHRAGVWLQDADGGESSLGSRPFRLEMGRRALIPADGNQITLQ